jgi:hypothetical protein
LDAIFMGCAYEPMMIRMEGSASLEIGGENGQASRLCRLRRAAEGGSRSVSRYFATVRRAT